MSEKFDHWLSDLIAINIETGVVQIIHNDKIVVDAPNIYSLTPFDGKAFVGREASFNRNRKSVTYPIKNGRLIDSSIMQYILNELIQDIPALRKKWILNVNAVISLPSELPSNEIDKYRLMLKKTKIRKFKLIPSIMANAIGIGVDIMQPKSNMIMEISRGVTTIGVVALGGIIKAKTIDLGVDRLNGIIFKFLKEKYRINIGFRSIEKIRVQIGTENEELEALPSDMNVQGQDIDSRQIKVISVSHKDISEALNDSINQLALIVSNFLKEIRADYMADIYNTGIYLTGEGALTRGLYSHLSKLTDLPVYIAEDPLSSKVRGVGISAKNFNRYTHILE